MDFKNEDDKNKIDEYKMKKKKENFVLISAVCLAIIIFLSINYALTIIHENKTKIAMNKEQNKEEENKKDLTKDTDSKNNSSKDKTEDKEDVLDLSENGGFLKSSEDYAYDASEIREYILSNKEYNGEKRVFLTFDDGVTPGITDRVLDILKENNVHATFFVVGKTLNNAAKPYLERELKEGNAIAIHSFSHDYAKLYPNRNPDVSVIKEEAEKTYTRLKELLGENFKTNVWRYPGGHISWKGLDGENNADEALKSLGLNWIDWNCLCGDAEPLKTRPTNKEEMMNFTKKSLIYWKQKDVVVILMHDGVGKNLTIETLPDIIEYFKSNGYEFGILK